MKYTLQLKIARDFINQIIAGELLEGDILPSEMELVSIYNTSRPTVREAMKILSTRNVIHAKQRVGTSVLPITQWNLLDPIMIALMDDHEKIQSIIADFAHVRTVIEADVVCATIDNISEQGKKDLTIAFNNLKSLTIDNQAEDFVNADYEFHKVIYENSNNYIYSSLSLIFKPIWLNEIDMIIENNYDFYIQDHTNIYDTIMSGDKSNIDQVISSHAQLFKKFVLK